MKYGSLLLIMLLAIPSCGAVEDKPKEKYKEKYQLVDKHGTQCESRNSNVPNYTVPYEGCIDREEHKAVEIMIANAIYKLKDDLENVVIGEYFVSEKTELRTGINSYDSYGINIQLYEYTTLYNMGEKEETISKNWEKFRKSNVEDEVDGYIKINNEWYPKENVIIYTDRYGELRKEIEARLKGE